MDRSAETDVGGSQRDFGVTAWTTVLEARNREAPDRASALDRLVRSYWKPAYFFVRRRGHDVEAAKDLTQGFFATFLEKDFLRDVSPEKGRFRSFMMAALTHYLSNQYDHARAQKRGGAFNFVEAESEMAAAAEAAPEQAYFDRWALEVMAAATAKLRAETPPDDFALLSGAKPAGMPDYDRKNRLHRMRLRLRELLRAEVLPTVANSADAEGELRELLSSSARRV